jgi:DNA-binding transcriptional regulator YiaG
MPAMKYYISKKTRKALLDAGFTIQSVNNWRSGRYKPSRVARQIILKTLAENSRKKKVA